MTKPIIVDSFCFFEDYQTNMLLVKFNVEDVGVDEWVITENSYSMRGDYKGPHQLKKILAADKRFEKFLSKIKVFEIDLERKCQPGVEDWEVIFLQREVQREYVFNKYSRDTWLLVSDTDEIVDFDNPNKAKVVYDALKHYPDQLIHLNPIFYAFDFDNTFTHPGDCFSLTLAQLSYLEGHKLRLEQARLEREIGHHMPRGSTSYHYHSCVSPQHIWRKLSTFGHTGYCKEDVNQWLYYNHGMFKSKLGEGINPNRFDLACVELTEQNSPLYVRENLDWLKVHSVHSDYVENRKKWLAGDREFPDIVGGN